MNPALLAGFFCKLRSITLAPLPLDNSGPTHPHIDVDALGAFIGRMHSPMHRLRAAGGLCNPWRVARLGRDEVRNTAVLAWLLDPAGDHGLGFILLNAMLALVNRSQAEIPAAVAGNVRVTREAILGDDGVNRVDIEIRCHDVHQPFYLVIEAKVDAREGEAQIPRYIAAAKSGAGTSPWAIVYLTVHGLDAGRTADCDYSQVLPVSWKNLARLLLRSLHDIDPSYPAYQAFSYRLAETFLRHMRAL